MLNSLLIFVRVMTKIQDYGKLYTIRLGDQAVVKGQGEFCRVGGVLDDVVGDEIDHQ